MPSPLSEEKRNEIIALKTRDLRVAEVARRAEVSTRSVYEVMKAWRESQPKLHQIDPREVVEEMLIGYRAAIEELAEIPQTGPRANPSAHIGAVKARMDIYAKITTLLQEVGAMPRNLGTLQIQTDFQLIAARVSAAVKRHKLAPEVVTDILDAIDPPANRPALPVGEG